jgi:nucleotide-binding universal stress UspA family protein
MKIMATFDGSSSSESIIAELEKLAHLPNLEILLLSVREVPRGQLVARRSVRQQAGVVAPDPMHPMLVEPTRPAYAEIKDQAVQRRLAELEGDLREIVARLPAGPRYYVEAQVSDRPSETILQRCKVLRPDAIVMATHGKTRSIHQIMGNTAEEVVRSRVAPVLLVPPSDAPPADPAHLN